VLVYFVNHSTAPVSLGGAERSLLALVEDWLAADADLQPYFLTKHPRGMFTAELERRGWPYRAIPFRGWAGPHPAPPDAQRAYFARDDYRAVLEMRALMLAERPALVVTNTLVAPWAAFAAASAGVPHAWLVREFGDLDHGLHFQTSAAETYADIGLLSTAVVANSRALAEHLAPHIDPGKLSWSYPRLDLDEIRRAARSAPPVAPFRDVPGLRVVQTGRIAPSKGQADLVEALALLRTRGIAAQVCFVGGAPETNDAETLRALVRARGLDPVVNLVGAQENPFPFAAAADVAVMASHAEAFGRTTLEYLALGLPVVAAESGGSAELVGHESSGMLVPPGDPVAIADALEGYALDPARIARHGAGARDRAAEIVAAQEARPLVQVLAGAIGGAPAPLPAIARVWFELPDLLGRVGGLGDRVTARFLVGRALGRAVGAARRLRPRSRAIPDSAPE